MTKAIISTAKLLMDKLDGEEPSPIMLAAWLAHGS